VRRKVLLSWSSGKDSAWALQVLRRDPALEVVGLLTTLNATHDRVAMHAVRRELLQRQAEAVGLPLCTVELPWPCSNADYERLVATDLEDARRAGIEAVAFGDLFLADVRAYRERQLEGTGLTPLFPLWGRPTGELAREMIAGGVRARLTCVDPRKLPASLAGRAYDETLLQELPEGVDPCGENGEFHTFVTGGPGFERPVQVTPGEVVEREGFVFADLLPG
jgi:uncharacterized protein (TIGR00290 family)